MNLHSKQMFMNRKSGLFRKVVARTLSLITFLVIIASSSVAQNNILEKKVTMEFEGVSLKDVLNQLRLRTGISFAYNSTDKVFDTKINKRYKNESLKHILDDLVSGKNMSYKIVGGKITVFKTNNRKTNIRIYGYIYDAQNGEALIGCNVYDNVTLKGTTSNQFGFYSLIISYESGDAKEIAFSYLGYEKQMVLLKGEDKHINIRLNPTANELEVAEVIGKKNEIREVMESSKMSTVELSAVQIRSIPAVAGETDLLKSITTLPGIKTGVDGSSGFYVRGGSIDQNLILLDGVPIYNPYHMWGYLSSFNADAINNVTITKGAFPARYGGRLSSVVDITMKEGNNREWEKDITIGLVSAKASISGPLVKDKSAIMLTARRTFADLIYFPISNAQKSKKGYTLSQGYYFADLNLKFNYKLSISDQLFFSGLYSSDKFHKDEKNDVQIEGADVENVANKSQGWGNTIAALRWNHLFKKNIFVNTTAYYSAYRYNTDEFNKRTTDDTQTREQRESSISYYSDIIDFAMKQDYQFFPSDVHNIRLGVSGIYHQFKPGVSVFLAKADGKKIDNTTGNKRIDATEIAAYLEDDWDVSRFIRINGGVHFSSFFVNEKTYYSFQPRISARVAITDKISFKAGYAHMAQYMHLLTSSGITQSSDLWVPATENIAPQQSIQSSLGTAVALSEDYLLEVEGYYKTMDNVIEYKNGASFLDAHSDWEKKIAAGKGKAYGVELFVEKKRGKLTGFVGYTLSWSNRFFEEINFGKTFPFRYDRRHDISVTGKYKFNEKWSLNVNWSFYTGNAVTVPTSKYIVSGYDGKLIMNHEYPSPGVTYAYPTSNGTVISAPYRNNYRLPNYHRLDVTASYRKVKNWGTWELIFGATNLYNKLNPSFFYVADEFGSEEEGIVTKYYQRTLFPFMPTLSFRVKF